MFPLLLEKRSSIESIWGEVKAKKDFALYFKISFKKWIVSPLPLVPATVIILALDL